MNQLTFLDDSAASVNRYDETRPQNNRRNHFGGVNKMVRKSDPETSKQAAIQHESSGKADSHRAAILSALKFRGGQTGHELGVCTGLGQVECCRRLADLHKLGQVEPRDGGDPCRVKPRSKQQRWFVTGGGK